MATPFTWRKTSAAIAVAAECRYSPAFDLTYSYNPAGSWTSLHQMSLNGKRDKVRTEDLLEFARFCDLKAARAKAIIDDVLAAAEQWPALAREAGVSADRAREVGAQFRRSWN